MKEYDIVIVGAGPAGSIAGLTLLRNGVNCLIIDECESPRFKLCGGLIMAKTLTDLKLQGFYNELNDLFANSCKKVTIMKKNEYVADLECMEPMYLVHRPALDEALLERYLKIGGEFIPEKVIEIDIENKEILLNNNQKISYNYLVGADGANGITQTYVRKSGIQYARGCGINISKNKLQFDNDRVLMDFGLFHDGFLCEFPKDNSITIGCICSRAKHNMIDLKKCFREVLETRYQYKAEENEIKEALVPYGWHCTELVNNKGNIILVGDAGGFSTCIPGDGIYNSILSGEVAATSIIHSKLSNEQATTIYQKLIQPQINYHNMVYNRIVVFYAWNDFFLRQIKRNKGAFATFFYDTQIAYNTYNFSLIKIFFAWYRHKSKYYSRMLKSK